MGVIALMRSGRPLVPVLTPCPGHHNHAWRRAEAAGLPHDLSPVWGHPVHCGRCTDRAQAQLAELPELLVVVALEARHGSRPKTTGTVGRTPSHRWPGEASRMLTDHIVGGLLDLEDDLRELRHLRPRNTASAEGQKACRAVQFVTAHLEWALTEHPMANEPHDRLSANPAAQIHSWHTTAMRFTRRDVRLDHPQVPCARCNLLSLYRPDGSDYYECRNVECGLLLTPAEYQAHTQRMTTEHARPVAA
ncbi:hypothetical protein CTZ27_33255 [Streptomyces griseocarneus]|nr:hypothetical protein CTZ27_33255 [Streptomyces griseocarneus]